MSITPTRRPSSSNISNDRRTPNRQQATRGYLKNEVQRASFFETISLQMHHSKNVFRYALLK
jgi:hypothetical protein